MSSVNQTGHYGSEDTLMIVSSCTQTGLAGVPLHLGQNSFDTGTNGELHHVLRMSDQHSVDADLCLQCCDSLVIFDGFTSAFQSSNKDDNDHRSIRVFCDKSVGTEQASADLELSQQELNNVDTLQYVSFGDLVNGSYLSVCKSDSRDTDDIQHADTQLDNPELLGAVGGYVNGFELEKSCASEREFTVNRNYKEHRITEYQLRGFGYVKSPQNFKSIEQSRIPIDSDDGVLYQRSSPAEDYTALNGIRSTPDIKPESDLCLDDYIDADMHLSPAAGRSLSSSSSLLSDDEDVISESDGNETFEKSRGGKSAKSNNFDGHKASCKNEFRHRVSSEERLNCCIRSLDSLDFVGSHDNGEVAHLVQSSGHPSTSSFDSLPTSLPSPSGNSSDVAGASEQFFHSNDDQKSALSMPSNTSMFSSKEFNFNGSDGINHCQNQSYRLPTNEKSDFYLPSSECKSCSDDVVLGRYDPLRKPLAEINQGLCFHTPLKASNGSNQPCRNREPLASSVDRTTVNRLEDCDQQSCTKCLGRHVSDETIVLPYSSRTSAAEICSQVGHQVDRNSNRCYITCEEAPPGHQGMRLSTSLNFKKSTVECDQRLTRSLHQPLSFEEDESDVSLKYTLDGLKDQSSLSSDVNCSSPWSRMSPLAIDRMNLNKVLRSLGLRDHQIEMNCLMELNCMAPKSSICEYLLACSRAGTSAQQIISRVSKLTGGHVYGKFFSFYPRRRVDLTSWLADWLQLGSVALVTARMQKRAVDASKTWQHLAVDSIQPEGMAVGCPPEVLSGDVLMSSLCSGSLIEVDRNEIISRWHSNCDLNELMMVSDSRWHELNVLGQTVNVLRESRAQAASGYRPILTPHIVLPTQIRSGITIFATVHSTAYERLVEVSEDLPLAAVDDSDADVETSPFQSHSVASASFTQQADSHDRSRTKSLSSKKYSNV